MSRRRLRPGNLPEAGVLKIAIIKLGALGDIIMSTPVIATLCSRHEKDRVSLLTSTPYAELFKNWPGLDLVHFPRHGIGASLSAALWLRRHAFDRVYDLQSNDRSRILCCLSGADEIVGTHKMFPYTHHPGNRYTGQTHILERHRQVLGSVGITLTTERPWLPVPESSARKITGWLDTHKLQPGKVVLMHAGASALHPAKRWPHFSALAEQLDVAGLRTIWIGADADADINQALAAVTGFDATNLFTVPELIALAGHAAFAVTNDSGPMHVLSCAEIAVFSLFGPTDWRRHHAIGQAAYVISIDRLSAAGVDIDPDGRDLSLVTAEMVWRVLLEGGYIAR